MVDKILNKKDLKLNYGKSILMTANNIALYNITNNIEKKETRYELKIKDIIKDILLKKTIPIKKEGAIFKLWHERFIKKVNGKDRKFNVSEKCISCGVCKKVCPVKNIEIKNKRPEFQHHCEQCFSCMHFCPEKAINYANRTQNRKRYHNKSFSFRDIEKFNNL